MNTKTTFLENFRNSVKNCHEKTAIFFNGQRLSYKELDEESDLVAQALRARGIKRGDIVPIILDRGFRAIIAMIAVLKTGAAFCNISIDYPKERIDFIKEDTKAKISIDNQFLENINKTDKRTTSKPEEASLDSDPAVIVYTSGSTGNPKGVVLSYKAMNMALAPNRLGIAEAESFLLISALSFIGGVAYALSPLSGGKTLHIASDSIRRDALQIIEYIREHQIVSAFFPPQMARIVLEKGDGLLQTLITGSEKVRSLHSQKTKVMNSWGASETFGPVTTFEIDQIYPNGAPIGIPYQGSSIFIIDENQNILPLGEEGEICVSGQIANGYLNLPELTAEKFIPNPSATNEHDMILYKTGDLGFLREDGVLIYVQRKDWMIKVSGFRVEPGEIEATMKKHSPIREAVVKSFQNASGDNVLYAVFTADKKVDPKEIKNAIQSFLPAYMIPQIINQLETLPLNANGKIDRLSIKPPLFEMRDAYEAPKNELEGKICALFEKITGATKVGINDNFFDLGGTSLSVTLFVISAEDEGLCDSEGNFISYSNVYLNPTPKELAALLSQNSVQNAPALGIQNCKDFDYTKINTLLADNTLSSFLNGKKRILGNVLLTGGTGFLGIHILYGLLYHTAGNITCLVRSDGKQSVEDRLRDLFFHYFEKKIEIGERLKIVEGDMLSADLDISCEKTNINTVINCAANVSHFARDPGSFDINTKGVRNLITFCMKTQSRLIHISTIGVAGFHVENMPISATIMDEKMLYFGQNLENQYLYSKFIAERDILEAATQGLDAKIMRVGNLMGRAIDGGFQINAESNSFVGRLRAYYAIGGFPYDSFLEPVEFSPVGITAGAILHLAGTDKSCRVFHVYNNNKVFLGDVIYAMKEVGISIELQENDAFKKSLTEAMRDPIRAKNLTSLVAYLNSAQGKVAYPIASTNDYTTQVLLRLGWRWGQTDKEYLLKFFTKLHGLFKNRMG